MDESLLRVEKLEERPPPPHSVHYTSEQESRLQRQVHKISISHSVSITYAIILSFGALATILITLIASKTLRMELRIWLGSIVGMMILALDIMLCIYAKDPVFAVHFVAVLMLLTGVAYSLSALHLFFL